MTTALEFYRELHGDNTDFLSKQSAIDFAEMFARKFYAQKLQQTSFINDSFFEESRKFEPPAIKELP